MVKALRQWLESHELPAIVAAVLGVIIMLSALLVIGGYLLVTP
jgi:redox-regulated HSP33 family molecular chaperone